MNACADLRRVLPVRIALLAGLLALFAGHLGCNDSADGAAGVDVRADSDMPPPLDMDPFAPDLGDCVFVAGDRCLDDPTTRCNTVRTWVDEGLCDDVDGDCFPGRCIADFMTNTLGDCDDERPDVNPGQAELCDEIDHDCDGDAIEPFELGDGCAACGRDGKVECAIDDPTTTTCSVYAGQSDAADPQPDEVCDGTDTDCDGRIDEGCRFDVSPDAERTEVTACANGRIVVIEDDALVSYTPSPPDGVVREVLRPVASSATLPSCGPAGLTWLETTGDCETPDDGPLRCPGTVWVWLDSSPVAERVAAPGLYGPPLITETATWWHSAPGASPVVVRRGHDEMVGDAAFAGPFSDPTAPVDGRIAVREWLEGEPRVQLVDLATGGTIPVDEPRGLGSHGPPVRSDRWIAWPVRGDQEIIWIVDNRGRDGFRPATSANAQMDPRLVGDRLVWQEDDGEAVSLRAFDLGTGDTRTLVRGAIAPGAFALTDDMLVWIESGVDGDRVYRRMLGPSDTPTPPDPDGGMPDAGLVGDAGPPADAALIDMDSGLLDAGPDMGPPEADMGPPEVDMAP